MANVGAKRLKKPSMWQVLTSNFNRDGGTGKLEAQVHSSHTTLRILLVDFNIDRWLYCLCCVGITCVRSPWLVSQLPLLRTWCLGCHTTLEDSTSRSTDVYPITEWNLAMTTAVHRHVHTQLTYNYIFNTKVTFFGWFHHSQLVQFLPTIHLALT